MSKKTFKHIFEKLFKIKKKLKKLIKFKKKLIFQIQKNIYI